MKHPPADAGAALVKPTTELVQGFPCPFCGRGMFKKTKVPKQFNLIWYCSGCKKRANNCQCIPLTASQLKLSQRIQKASDEQWNYIPGSWASEVAALENTNSSDTTGLAKLLSDILWADTARFEAHTPIEDRFKALRNDIGELHRKMLNSPSSDTTALKALAGLWKELSKVQSADEQYIAEFEDRHGEGEPLEQAASKNLGYVRADTRVTFIKELREFWERTALISDSSTKAAEARA
jgi:ribosomal protein L37AE/L43A